jgi:L-lactate dehydrogenase
MRDAGILIAVKIAIVGAGEVGATAGYACLLRGVSDKLVLCDLDRAKAEAQALDLAHGVQFARMTDIWGTDDLRDCAGAEVVVLAAGAKQRPNQTRLDLAADNVAMCRMVLPEVLSVAPDALILVVTNPVDVVTRAALDVSGLDPSRVIGSGTVLDTSRLRRLLSERCGVAVQNVHAYVVGEHGDSQVALWSSATVGGIPLASWGDALGGTPSAEERDTMLDDVRQAAYRIVAGKGATNHAIGVVTARIIEAVDRDERRVLPVSTYHADYQGIADVCFSIPTIVDRRGVAARLDVPMDEAEHAALAASAEAIRGACATVGL